MQINLIAIGTRMPGWVEAGFAEYIKRLPAECRLELKEIAAIKRNKSYNAEQIMQQESDLLLAASNSKHWRIALERQGKIIETLDLSKHIESWLLTGVNVDILIGGPEGISQKVLQKVDAQWSLSAMTLPHPLVRVILAEQIYRAFSIIKQHPYHRG